MIGGIGVRSTTNPTGRFIGPDQYQKTLATLHKKESQLAAAKKDVNAQRGLMMRAMFSPEGYKAAEAKLHRLEAKVTKLTAEVRELKHLITVA